MHLLAFWVSFLQVAQAKERIRFDVQTAVGVGTAFSTAWQTKDFLLCRYPFRIKATNEIFKFFYGVILGSITAVLELTYPVLLNS